MRLPAPPWRLVLASGKVESLPVSPEAAKSWGRVAVIALPAHGSCPGCDLWRSAMAATLCCLPALPPSLLELFLNGAILDPGGAAEGAEGRRGQGTDTRGVVMHHDTAPPELLSEPAPTLLACIHLSS